MPSTLPCPRRLEAVESRAPLHDVELEKRGLAEAGEKQSGGQRREQRRHLGVGDQPSVHEAEYRRQRKGCGEGGRQRVAVLHHLEHEPRRNRQRRDQRNVDAAADHDDRHGQAQNAEHRHVLQQRQHVRGGEEARQRNREDGKKSRENRKNDSLLPDVPDSHPGFSWFLVFCRRCWLALIANATSVPAGKFRGRFFVAKFARRPQSPERARRRAAGSLRCQQAETSGAAVKPRVASACQVIATGVVSAGQGEDNR